jgi:hypothetical protein
LLASDWGDVYMFHSVEVTSADVYGSQSDMERDDWDEVTDLAEILVDWIER